MTDYPQRRSIRLDGYDYSESGAYFVTICAHEKQCIFGSVTVDEVSLNRFGQIALEEWEQTAALRNNVELDAFVVMPNHMHGIIVITTNTEFRRGMMHHARANEPDTHPSRKFSQPVANSLPSIVGAYKAAVTRQINRLRGTLNDVVWQRNYHEHIIRTEADLNRLRMYVANNAARWTEDSLYAR